MKSQIAERMEKVVYETLEVVCFLFPLEPWEMAAAEMEEIPSDAIRSVVTFDGAATGGMILKPSHNLLDAIAENMTGSDEASPDEKEAALCELANIICGNTVPFFSKNRNFCSIHPPFILPSDSEIPEKLNKMDREPMKVYLDEGALELCLFYSVGGAYD